jgi:UDP:flavonoid glycosyltransferase YjiC (YdhE family)
VVADYSPAAALATRTRLPLIIVGNGYTTPPPEMMEFPLLHRYHPPVWTESRVLATVNAAMRSMGLNALEYLPQIFAADARVIDTFEFFDPYALQRQAPVDGAAFERTPIAREQDADQLVVYLSRGIPIHRDTVSALAPFGPKLMIYAPELDAADEAALEWRDATVTRDPFSLDQVLPRARLAIHLGGPGFAAHCLAAGVPQLVLARQGEHEFNGLALEHAGIGQLIRAYDADSKIESETIAAMMTDETLAIKSHDIGLVHREIATYSDPVSKFERLSLQLLDP